MISSRRSFLTGLGSLLAAPAIVKASSLMPVKALSAADLDDLVERMYRESLEYLDGMSQQIAATIIYGTEVGGVAIEPVNFAEYYRLPLEIAA